MKNLYIRSGIYNSNIRFKYMDIKVLGTGCAKCKTLEKLTREVVGEMGIEADIEKVEDIAKIMGYRVMQTPALVINGKVVLNGRVPTAMELKQLLSASSNPQTWKLDTDATF